MWKNIFSTSIIVQNVLQEKRYFLCHFYFAIERFGNKFCLINKISRREEYNSLILVSCKDFQKKEGVQYLLSAPVACVETEKLIANMSNPASSYHYWVRIFESCTKYVLFMNKSLFIPRVGDKDKLFWAQKIYLPNHK